MVFESKEKDQVRENLKKKDKRYHVTKEGDNLFVVDKILFSIWKEQKSKYPTPEEFIDLIENEESYELVHPNKKSPYLEALRSLRYEHSAPKSLPPRRKRDASRAIAASLLFEIMPNTKVAKRVGLELDSDGPGRKRPWSGTTQDHIKEGDALRRRLASDNIVFGPSETNDVELFFEGFPVSEFKDDVSFADSPTALDLLTLLLEVRGYYEDGKKYE